MKKIVIDPGHGGKDRANKGPTGYVEADGVLKISLFLEAELLSTKAFSVKLTRRTDSYFTLTTRGKKAAGADMFISEHTNASNGKARGTTVFYSVDLPKDKLFAQKMSEAISGALGIPDRGAKTREYLNTGEDYYTVIDTAQDIGCPHVFLIENAFHDNPEDEKLLKKEENLLKIARAQAKVICDMFGIAYPAQAGGSDQQAAVDIKKLPLVKLGSKNDAVKLLQQELKKAGFDPGAADGIFGAKTEGAVKKYQAAAGLVIDGIVGQKTWKALFTARMTETESGV